VHGQVVEKELLTPALVRIVLGGGDLDQLSMVEATDAYVNLAFRPSDAPYDRVFDPAAVRAEVPRESWPVRRRYTVRAWDPVERHLTLDFVVHGDAGVAGPWAARAEVGDVLVFEGPAGGFLPDPEADWVLLVGDESALPAIAASLEAMSAGTVAVARVLCDGDAHELALDCAGRLDLRWIHRTGGDQDERLLADALREADFPPGRLQAFVHGEATEIREIRRHLLGERGLSRQEMSCSPYWRRTMTDEAWRAVKRDFVTAMEADA
jgi:NADPH-dependent ferric siderophore reductase